MTTDRPQATHLALLIGGFRRLGLGEPMTTYPFKVLHPDSTEQDTYDAVVADLGFDPLSFKDYVRRWSA